MIHQELGIAIFLSAARLRRNRRLFLDPHNDLIEVAVGRIGLNSPLLIVFLILGAGVLIGQLVRNPPGVPQYVASAQLNESVKFGNQSAICMAWCDRAWSSAKSR